MNICHPLLGDCLSFLVNNELLPTWWITCVNVRVCVCVLCGTVCVCIVGECVCVRVLCGNSLGRASRGRASVMHRGEGEKRNGHKQS